MANMCEIEMMIKGEKSARDTFINALQGKGKVIIGRQADVDVKDECEDYVLVYGDTKWSVQSSLIDDALSMRKQVKTGDGHWYGLSGDVMYMTLWEACKHFNVNVEVYSSEPGCEFQEHYIFQDGGLIKDECVSYTEVAIYFYDTKAEAETDLNIKISDDDWENGYIKTGGFAEWNYSVESPAA